MGEGVEDDEPSSLFVGRGKMDGSNPVPPDCSGVKPPMDAETLMPAKEGCASLACCNYM